MMIGRISKYKRPYSSNLYLFSSGLLLAVLITGCRPNLPVESLETSSAPSQITSTLTPTIVWFPPTATTTRSAVIAHSSSPSPPPPLALGDVILSEDFKDPINWDLGESTDGTITPGINELSLAVSRSRGFVTSRLQGFNENDYYLEISANPTICRGKDEYGLLFRIGSEQDFFRYALTCDGHARLDRVLRGEASASVPPTLHSAVPPGAPSRSRLGVWVKGDDLRFYANGQQLFGVKDASLPGGGIGVFARAAGDDSVTVNFSDLILYALPD